jgi:hypothetical protein
MRAVDAFNSRILRLLVAYTIGLNVFGLVLGLSYVLGSLLHMAEVVGGIGGLAGIALGAVAGWRTYKALKRFSQ